MRLYFEAVLLVGLVVLCRNALFVMGDIGTARSYDPPYLPVRCPGYTSNNMPQGNLFAAAGSLEWHNGAACGRKYRVACVNGPKGACKDDIVMIEVVDVCRNGACSEAFVLAKDAFAVISKNLRAKINIEYNEV
ncbi:hypothetical protein H6P81_004165 [Aristolochia fimbriata]|uniref:Expansin-like EG45 domain-containing protein n=1 Tax=Aristolochia fimbriata TaxID=158543 RepID=A0AAV7FHB4_ARIFI|nr:hypothetical protein H6P81_004165 [Aristolochia fimbriata]